MALLTDYPTCVDTLNFEHAAGDLGSLHRPSQWTYLLYMRTVSTPVLYLLLMTGIYATGALLWDLCNRNPWFGTLWVYNVHYCPLITYFGLISTHLLNLD